MEIRPIHTDAEYRAALRELSAFFDNEPAPGTPDGDRFEALLTLVEDFEAKLPPERIKFGSMLASIAREAGGLTDAEAEAFNQLRDKEPAIPVGETSPHEIGGLSPSDQQCIAQALLAPPPPSPALDRAFARRSDLLADGALSQDGGSAARLRRNETD